ncbi:diguanylate cyclase [Stenotrophomonas sp. HITSZ_GD]|uniref:ligand-binding sensor domain-containing diguanylate cyclase n=1 Tax=Stenotrophomonas sp. HITSZ_GD TaxID=3037248 RepID=UPI00240D8A8F|nr:diguanylate cyclase [Stenotrophomonas sp. HITSZ_GD]MDG2526507.1 diguanylate cyclase [Stenotrophomonas sp. HITSZ_GD]
MIHAAAWLCALAGLAFPAAAQNYSFRAYAQAEGLQGLSVSALYEDRQGVVWAGTELGLHRYERERFHVVGEEAGISSIYVRAITEDSAGRLWVGTSNGLYVRRASRFESVQWQGRPLQLDNGNTLVAQDDGVVAISHHQLLRISPDENGWQVRPIPLRWEGHALPPMGEALMAEGERLWVACGTQLCRIEHDGRITPFGPAQGLPGERLQAILRARDGTLWVRGGDHVLSLPPGRTRFIEHPAPVGGGFTMLSGATNLALDPRGRVVTRANTGLVRWEGDRWRLFSRSQGVDITPLVGPILVQRDGRFWIGTRGLGVQRWLAYDRIEHWDESQGLAAAPTWAILRTPQGELLVGGDAGSNQLDPASRRMGPWTLADGRPLQQTTSLTTAPDGAVWLGRSSGAIARRDPLDGSTRDVAEVPAGVRVVLFDREGVLWIVTGRGVYALAPGSERPVRERELPVSSFDDARIDAAGRLWLTSSAGLYRRVEGHWRRVEVVGALPSQDFSRISLAPDGGIWLSLNDAGLWQGRMDEAANRLSVTRVDDPLVSRIMPFILRHDSRGWLWLGSSQGLDLLRDGRWIRVTQAEGLLWDDTSANAFFEDHDGAVWIGSSRGLSRIFDPAALFAPRPLKLEIARVRRGDQPVLPGSALLWSEQPLDIDLSTPGAAGGSDRVVFRYRINDHAGAWISTAQDHLVYPILAPGHYTLEVQAEDLRQRQLSNIVQFAVDVLPPWWRSPLAILVYVLLAFAAVLGLLRWRVSRLLARERELERLVDERTHELQREKQELEAARASLAIKATRDDLTGLLNRTGILEAMAVCLAQARRDGEPLAVVLIDLDYFKQINDVYGHLAGDAVLARVGRRLDACLRGSDQVGRYGGEELLAVMPGLSPLAHGRLRTIHDAICGTPYAVDDIVLEVTCSMGVAWYREGETVGQLLARTDAALYRAKHGGRNRMEIDEAAASPEPGLGERPPATLP